ncbi:disease resistance protein RUN1-like [Rosa chinensis]|uniref:disease resistance protein RUN1-like n=1 Tax=Rosa chinensis TaxID=74649 RepID=UPI000D08DE95|nr:disease resistance protein RUN1-like [Rosa chinensis]
MNEEEALELFSWHAFQNYSPKEDYIELSRRVVTYCGGLPLALEVLGSFLFGRSIGDWNSTLKKLEKFPDDKIQSKLRISFDALEEWQRHIFLHICRFFIGMDKNHVIKILEGCGLAAGVAISVLSERCLVTVNEKDKVMMHDLLRDMGREIVRQESPNHPERRSRLWREEDVIDVLRYESGTEETEGLALNLQRSGSMTFSTEAFRNMRELKLLQLKNVLLSGAVNKLPKKLRWLCLRGSSDFSLITEDKFLDAIYLVSMDLRYNRPAQYWEYFRRLGPLWALQKIDRSIGLLSQLALLNLKGCTKLKDLPEDFYMLRSVRTLVLSGCSKFEKLSKHIGKMDSLRTLVISGTAISEVPSSIDKMRNLDFSSRQGLKGLKRFTQDEISGPSQDETSGPSEDETSGPSEDERLAFAWQLTRPFLRAMGLGA